MVTGVAKVSSGVTAFLMSFDNRDIMAKQKVRRISHSGNSITYEKYRSEHLEHSRKSNKSCSNVLNVL